MIRSGQTIENPVTGAVLVFHKTSRDTGGEYVLVETIPRPGATVAATHSHPYQSETFHVVEGCVGFKVGGKNVELEAGDGVTVLPRRLTSSGTPATVRPGSRVRCALPAHSSS